MKSLEERIKAQALGFGFADAGIVRPEPTEHATFYEAWVEAGRYGEMGYLARSDARERRYDLNRTLSAVRSVVVVAHDYAREDPEGVPDDPSVGVVARYARGADYHDVIKPRLLRLLEWIRGEVGGPVEGRAYTDTGPILERDLARRAGLGWFGRNTMLIHPRRGSYFLLGVLLLDLDLEPDPPYLPDRCGTCTACLDGCPTGALLGRDETGAPVMDATRCISYLTIELKGPIPTDLRPAIGNRIFGCDICQEVCPWNARPEADRAPDGIYAGGRYGAGIPLVDLMAMDEEAWRAFRARSALRRPGRAAFLRNVAVALGNGGSPEAVPVLVKALEDPEPLVRGHAAWALGELGGAEARRALIHRAADEPDSWVQEEVERALGETESRDAFA